MKQNNILPQAIIAASLLSNPALAGDHAEPAVDHQEGIASTDLSHDSHASEAHSSPDHHAFHVEKKIIHFERGEFSAAALNTLENTHQTQVRGKGELSIGRAELPGIGHVEMDFAEVGVELGSFSHHDEQGLTVATDLMTAIHWQPHKNFVWGNKLGGGVDLMFTDFSGPNANLETVPFTMVSTSLGFPVDFGKGKHLHFNPSIDAAYRHNFISPEEESSEAEHMTVLHNPEPRANENDVPVGVNLELGMDVGKEDAKQAELFLGTRVVIHPTDIAVHDHVPVVVDIHTGFQF